MRRDLADVRLADRVFAPHYAAHIPHVASHATQVLASRERDSEVLAMLAPGDLFEVLELSAGLAWGSAPGQNVVGYVDATHLGRVA